MKKVLIYALLPLFLWSCGQQGSDKKPEKKQDTNQEVKPEEEKPADYEKPGLTFKPVEHKNKLSAVNPKSSAAGSDSISLVEVKQLFDEAVQYLKNGKHAESVEAFTQVIVADPKNQRAYYNRGIAYFSMNDFVRADADFTRVIQMQPKDTSAYLFKGLIRYNQKDFEGAIREYTNAINNGPNYATAYYNRGIAYGELKSYALAISDFDKALSVNPNNNEYLFNSGLAALFSGDTVKACQAWKKASDNGYEKAIRAVDRYCK